MSRCGELNEGQSLLGRTKQRRSLLPPLSGSPPSPPGAPFDLANVDVCVSILENMHSQK